MSVLEMHGVSRVYGQGAAEVHALTDINLNVEAGSMVAVMGPSGSGKSTLLTIAGSLEEPSSGEVIIAGASLIKMSRNAKARLRRRSIGFVFQDYTPGSLLEALQRALSMFGRPGIWRTLQLSGMAEDHSWDRSAAEYVRIYDRAVRSRPRGRSSPRTP